MKESKLQADIATMMRKLGWTVVNVHGGMYSAGLPDLAAFHDKHGPRDIEVKKPKGWKFTESQLRVFPEILRSGRPIWFMRSVDDYPALFNKPNFCECYRKLIELTGVQYDPCDMHGPVPRMIDAARKAMHGAHNS